MTGRRSRLDPLSTSQPAYIENNRQVSINLVSLSDIRQKLATKQYEACGDMKQGTLASSGRPPAWRFGSRTLTRDLMRVIHNFPELTSFSSDAIESVPSTISYRR